MPLPTAYATEYQLAEYALSEVAEYAALLGWSAAGGQAAQAVADAVHACGAADAASVADVPRLRAEAVLAVLRRAKLAVATRYDLALDGQTLSRGQLLKGVEAAIAEAERKLAEAGGGPYALAVGRMRYAGDEYSYLPDDLRPIP